MDQIKTGKFIAEMRKANNLTQKQLAEKLGISDKAVSKWECGKSMPDNAILLNLCEVLDINVNELLSGERLSKDDYHGKAEENIMNLINENKKRPLVGIMTVILSFISLIAWTGLLILSMNGSIYWFLDIYSFIPIIAFTLIVLVMSGSLKDFFMSFKICFAKKLIISVEQIRRSYAATRLTIIATLVSGALSSFLAIVAILSLLDKPEILGPNMAVAVLSILYSLIIVLFLLPIGKILYLKLYEK